MTLLCINDCMVDNCCAVAKLNGASFNTRLRERDSNPILGKTGYP